MQFAGRCLLTLYHFYPCYLCILVRPKTLVSAFIWRLNCCFMLLHTQGQSECSLLCWLLVRPSLVRTLAAYAFREQRTHNDASLLRLADSHSGDQPQCTVLHTTGEDCQTERIMAQKVIISSKFATCMSCRIYIFWEHKFRISDKSLLQTCHVSDQI